MNMVIVWIIVTVAAAVVEIATQALVSTWFVVAGFAALLLAALNWPIWSQLVAFIAVSVFSFVFIRRYMIPYTQVKFTPTNFDRLIGQEAKVTREIPIRGRGEVVINGQFWTARSDDPEKVVPAERSVLIRAIEGASMIVSLIDEE